MKLTIKNTAGKDVKVKDANGRQIPHAFSYDTGNKKVGVYLYATPDKKNTANVVTGKKNGKVYIVTTYVTIPGSYAEINGKLVK